jgi:hypothetical protein
MIEDVLCTAYLAENRVRSVLQWLVPMMCELPQAQGMQLSSVIEWLQIVLARSSEPEVTAALCSWVEFNAAQPQPVGAAVGASFGSREAESLLASALPTDTSGSVLSFETMCSLECIRRKADAGAVVRVLDSTLAFGSEDRCSYPAAATALLLQLPAAAHIPAFELARLLTGVLEQCSDAALTDELLQELKHSGSLPGPDDLLSLIHTCLLWRSDECAAACIQLLCSDPAAQQVSVSKVQQLAANAVEMRQPLAFAALIQCLPAAAQLSSKPLEQLLSAAITAALDHSSAAARSAARSVTAADPAMSAGWAAAAQAVVSMPAAGDINADTMLKLVVKAVEQGSVSIVQQLATSKSLQKLNRDTLVSLLQLAVRQQQLECLQVLLQLRGADSSLSAGQTAQLLQDSIGSDDSRMVAVLCGMQSAQLLDQQEVLELLRAAVNGKSLAAIVPLCKLQAAAKLSAPFVVGLIDEVHDEVRGLQAAAKHQRAADVNSIVKRMNMSSAASSRHVAAKQELLTRKQLGLQAVAALQDLQYTARITGTRLL